MATLYSTQITNDMANPPVRGEFNRNGSALRCKLGKYTLSGSEASGDVLQMVTIPKGAIVNRHLSYMEWEDPGTTFTVELGDGVDADRYASTWDIKAASATTVVTLEEAVGVAVYHEEYEYTAEDTIDLTLTSVGTPTAGQDINLFIVYTMNG